MKPTELVLEAIPKRTRPRKPAPLKTPRRQSAYWRRVVRSLRMDGPQTVKAMATNLNLPAYTVQRTVNFYIRHGVIERVGRKYKLTDRHADFGKLRVRKVPARPPRSTAWQKVLED